MAFGQADLEETVPHENPAWLLDYQKSISSQFGEDGVIAKVLSLIPDRNNWCVEFGAWDGKHLSNTYNLIVNDGFSAVLIEGDQGKFQDLQENFKGQEKVHTLNQYVGFGEKDNLDQILKTTPIPKDFDFLSIDIDGNDYYVWQALSYYQPKVVIVEFNPTIPSHVRFVQAAELDCNCGASLLSLVELAKEKGYQLVSVFPVSAIFVREEYFPLFEIENNDPAVLRKDLSFITYLCVAYDGAIFLAGNRTLPWHSLEIVETKLQYLPKFLRKFPERYNKVDWLLFDLFRFFTEPSWKRLMLSMKYRTIRAIQSITTKDKR